MTNQQEQFKKDAQGRLVPLNLVKDIDLIKDDVLNDLFSEALALQEQMKAFKIKAMLNFKEFLELAANEHNVIYGGKKGNCSLISYDGSKKIIYSNADLIHFDEKLYFAKEIIDDLLKEWTAESSDEIKVIIQDAFITDKEGKLSTDRILSLTRINITNERWQEAMKLIKESILVVDTKNYIRFYQKDKEGQYIALSLNWANL